MTSSAEHAAEHLADRPAPNTPGEFQKLMADIEELLARVTHVKDPDIARVRGTVQEALVSARDTIVDSAAAVTRRGRQAAAGTDAFVRGSPWQAVGIAALIGATVGYLAARKA